KSDPPKAKEIAALQTEVHAAFQRPRRELRNTRWQQASGTSGTILSIGTTLRDAGSNNSDRKNQAVQPPETDIPLSKLAELNVQLANMDVAQRRALPGITAQRSEIIIAGSLILEEAM